MSIYSDAEIAAINQAAREIAETIIRTVTDHLVEVVLGSAYLMAAVRSISAAYGLDAGPLGARLNRVVSDMANESREP
jgi:hypothetical protein